MEINFFNNTTDVTVGYEDIIKRVLKNEQAKKIMNIIFLSSLEIQKMNKDFRGIDSVTDVISFANQDNIDLVEINGIDDVNDELGDIFICIDRAKEQAISYGHSLEREMAFLAVHGYLHLCGYDHQTKEQEKTMFDLQEKILVAANLGRS